MLRARTTLWMILALVAPLAAHPESEVAIAELTRLIERTPRQPSLWFARSAHYRHHGDWERAEADLLATEALARDHPGLDLALAQVFLETARFPQARERAERVIRKDPSIADAHLLLARTLSRSGDVSGSLRSYGEALRRMDEPPVELFLERAALPVDTDLRVQGIDEGLARIGPAHVLLTRALELDLDRRNLESALRRIDQLIAQSERKESWLRRRGDLLAEHRRTAEARTSYELALSAIASLPDWLRTSPAMKELVATLHHSIRHLPVPPTP